MYRVILVIALLLVSTVSFSQDRLPRDNGMYTYHVDPNYRESESHPIRIVGYLLHPIGWIAREAIFRPLSYFMSSSEFNRSFFGYRDPYDWREAECFSPDSSVPDCRTIMPFDYGKDQGFSNVGSDSGSYGGGGVRQVYLPDVNFDFNVRRLNSLGKGRVNQIAKLLENSPGVNVVLEGHADYIGSESYNEKLGMDRAEAVRAELVGLGLSSEMMSTVTFGKSRPVFEEEADWARAVNRRVEVHVGEGSEHTMDDMTE